MELNQDPQAGPKAPSPDNTQFLPSAASPPTMDPGQPAWSASRAGSGSAHSAPKTTGLHGEPGTPPATVDDFLRLLFASGLCDERQYETWRERQQSPPADCHTLSEALVQDKILTPYQVSVLLNGQTRGLLFGHYEILGPLGEGGMGMVYRARHNRMRREVAIKILPRELIGSEEAVHRFHREVQAAAKLHHPNIAAAYDAGDEDNVHYLVMELVEGRDLASYVAEAGELPAPVAVQLVIQAARGLAHAHLQDVVHRDIKPANLVVNGQGTLKLLDMGLAQLKSLAGEDRRQLTQMGQAMGTVDYMAPEQAVDAHSVDHRADIYGLGCTLYFLLTARAISPDGAIVQKLMWHQTAPRPSLCDVCPDATPRLNLIFQRMVAIKPADRYSKMRDVVEDLEQVLPELRLGEGELPLIGDDMALYIGMDALAPHSSPKLPDSAGEAPLHATLPPQSASGLAGDADRNGAPPMAFEQQIAAAAVMIGKEVAAETADGRTIRGVVNRLSIESKGEVRKERTVLLHVGAADFALHDIREVFYRDGGATM